jgi:hypothetical protein
MPDDIRAKCVRPSFIADCALRRMTMRGIPCERCGWNETAHQFPDDYRMCDHKYVPEKHLRGLDNDRPQAAIDAASEADQRSHAAAVAHPVEAP